jgi:TIR domain
VTTPDTRETAEPIGGPDAPAAASSTYVQSPRVFISYRRDDTSSFVDVLDRRLREDLTSTNVYRDVKNNILGQLWEERIEEEIGRSDAVMVVVGPRWKGPEVGPVDESRLFEPGDMVRREVALALRSSNESGTLPILVDDASLPPALPDDLEQLRKRHHVRTTADEIAERDSDAYQQVLVGVWHAKKESVPNGVIVFGGESAKAKAVVAEIVSKLQHQAPGALVEVTRYACNARVMSRRRARRLGRKYPDVIIVVDEDSADSPILTARVDEIRRRKIRNVVVVAVGGGLVLGAGTVTGTGRLAGLSDDLGSALSGLEPTKVVGSVSKLTGWWATTTVATHVTAIALSIGVVAAAAALIDFILPDDDSVQLEGNWSVGDFALDDFQFRNPEDFEIVPGGLMSFERVDDSCSGETCALELLDGPPFMRGAIFTPSDEGSFDVEFPDERGAIAELAPGGFSCSVDGADLTPFAELGFDARLDEETDELMFFLEVYIPPVAACREGFLEWSANATEVADD